MQHIKDEIIEGMIRKIITNKSPESLNYDLKQQWYKSNAELLRDIICFANTLSGPLSYIIIGITDDFKVCGIQDGEMSAGGQQDRITNVLMNAEFSGEYRPEFYVTSLNIDGKRIDVIVINSNSRNVPFFLHKRYGRGDDSVGTEIYTRIQGRNSDRNKQADRPTIERLWKKHFELASNPTPLEQLKENLTKVNYWLNNHEPDGFNTTLVYSLNPDFALYFDRDASDGDERHQTIYQYIQTDSTPRSYWLKILIGSRVVECLEMRELDGGRLVVPTPQTSFLHTKRWDQGKSFRYFTLDSLDYFVLYFCYFHNPNSEAEIALIKMLDVVDLYEDEQEVNQVKDYIASHMNDYLTIEKEVSSNPVLIGNSKGSRENSLYESMHGQIITSVSVKKAHERWRQEKGLGKLLFGDGI